VSDQTTRRADAIARLGGVDNLSETFRILRERSGRIVESGDTICGSIATAAIIDLAEIALSAPDSDGAALRRLRKKMMDCWQDRIETKKRFDVNTPDRREAQAEANAFQIACFEIDGELAARQDTPTTNGGCNANEVQEVRKRPDRVQPVVPEAADSPGVPDVHLPRGTVGADAPQGADSMAESAGAPAMHGREPERVEPPAREPDEIEAWSAKASTAPIDEKGNTRYESDPMCRGTEYSRYVLCRSEIDQAVAIMRRHRDRAEAAKQLASITNMLDVLRDAESELASLRAQLAEAERRAAIDQRQCDEMTSEAGRLASLLREAERDAGRWRAVRPLMRAEGWIRTDMARECWLEMRYRPVEGEGLTVEQIVDALAQREAKK